MKNKGITLVALVVTIIIMLILAGVTLRLTLGDNGLIKKAKETTEGYEDVVWIPRYAYSINEYHVEKNLEEGTTQNITKVEFIKGTGNRGFNGTTYETSYDEEKVTVGEPTPMIVHPAFTFGEKSLSGIWVAKFEASMAEENKNTVENNDQEDKPIKILPNSKSWKYIKLGTAFMNCYNMNGNSNVYGIRAGQVDSHLIKNTEWGCVAYLSASQYGVVPTINDLRENDITWTGEKNYVNNISQSTTGNVTGIYDMNGGVWEHVAAYYDNGDSNLNLYGTEAFESNNQLKSIYTKYWNKYEVSVKEIEKSRDDTFWKSGQENNQQRKIMTDERYKLMINCLGDAIHEVVGTNYSFYGKLPNNQYDWLKNADDNTQNKGTGFINNDFVLIGNCDLPFIQRGGERGWNDFAGIFACGANDGVSSNYTSFRPVLVV